MCVLMHASDMRNLNEVGIVMWRIVIGSSVSLDAEGHTLVRVIA